METMVIQANTEKPEVTRTLKSDQVLDQESNQIHLLITLSLTMITTILAQIGHGAQIHIQIRATKKFKSSERDWTWRKRRVELLKSRTLSI
jgi:hypothetical protein